MKTPPLTDEEMVRLATPLYAAMLGHIPFYREWGLDERKWRPYIMSAYTASRELVERSMDRKHQSAK